MSTFAIQARPKFGLRLFIFLTVMLLGAAAPRPAAAQVGGIQGFVRDTLGNPIGGAIVRADLGPSSGRETTTGSDGAYALTGLSAGQYRFSASRSGFQTQVRNFQVFSGSPSRVDFSLQSLTSQGGAIQGTVVASSNRAPLSGATVRLSQGAGFPAQTVTTDDSGLFRFEDLEAGSYRLNVDREGFSPQSRSVTVRDGRLTNASFALQGRSSEFGTLEGTIRTQDGSAVRGVQVRLTGGVTSRTAQANASGFFRMINVVPDSYVLVVSASGFEDQEIPITITSGQRLIQNITLRELSDPLSGFDGFVVDEDGDPIIGARIQITQGPVGVNRFELTDETGFYELGELPAGRYTLQASASGFEPTTRTINLAEEETFRADFRLRFNETQQVGTVSGRVTDTQGTGVAGVRVRVTQGPSTGQNTETDDDGDYAIGDLPAGTYTLTFTKTGFTSRTLSGVQVVSRQTTDLDVTLTGGNTGTGSLTGIVRDDADSQPLAGVTVTLIRNGSTVDTRTTDTAGGFTFSNLAAGTYSVRFGLNGYATLTRTVQIVNGDETTISVRLLAGNSSGTISGRVQDNGNRPIQGALVELSGSGDTRELSTDEDGLFRFVNVPAGNYTLTVSAAGLTPVSRPVNLSSGGSATVNFTLIPNGNGGTITGTVFNPSGQPIPAVITLVFGPRVGESRNASSNGRFTFTGLPAGTYTLEVSSPGYRTRRVNTVVRNAQTSTISVFLPR